MTSTERIIEQLNRQKDAQDRRELAQKKSASAKLTKAGKSRSRGASRSALRTAGKSKGGKGIAIKSGKSGRGFVGVARYATDPQKAPEYIGPADTLKSMIAASTLRPDIKNPVGHIVLSLPPSTGRLDAEKWGKIVEDFRAEIGIDDSYPTTCIRHKDTEHDHVHLIFSRVSIAGRVHDAANIGLRCRSAERAIEQRHNLPLVPTPPRPGPQLKKGEIEQALRTNQPPARLEIARALDVALADRPTLPQLVERLELSGITCKINQSATTGKISGLSFEHNGVAFKASQIGRQYGWQSLSQRLSTDQQEVTHDKARTSPQPSRLVHDASTERADDARAAEPTPPAYPVPSAPSFDRASPAPGATSDQKAQPVGPATPAVPAGFANPQILDDGLRDWVGTIGDRIRIRARMAAHAHEQRRQQLTALIDAQERVIAIRTADGWAIPDPSKLDDEQLAALIAEIGEGVEIEIAGRESFIAKVRALRQPAGPTPAAPERPNEAAIERGAAEDADRSSAPAPH